MGSKSSGGGPIARLKNMGLIKPKEKSDTTTPKFKNFWEAMKSRDWLKKGDLEDTGDKEQESTRELEQKNKNAKGFSSLMGSDRLG